MRRYKFLEKEDVYDSLNRLRNSFLAAKDGNEVESIINGILTTDEKLKIGRRVLIAEYLVSGFTVDEIVKYLKVGRSTVQSVNNSLEKENNWLELIKKRGNKVESEYRSKAYSKTGGSTLFLKPKSYTGFKRKDVKR
jgi:uncharacterized protein YerC